MYAYKQHTQVMINWWPAGPNLAHEPSNRLETSPRLNSKIGRIKEKTTNATGNQQLTLKQPSVIPNIVWFLCNFIWLSGPKVALKILSLWTNNSWWPLTYTFQILDTDGKDTLKKTTPYISCLSNSIKFNMSKFKMSMLQPRITATGTSTLAQNSSFPFFFFFITYPY